MIFLISLFLGIILPAPGFIEDKIRLLIESLAKQTENMNLSELIFFIFKNNLTVSIIGIVFGIFFGFVPLLLAISNGFVLGYVIKTVLSKLGFLSGLVSLWKLFPHGIFELPAVIISLGVGLGLGMSFISYLNKNSLRGYSSKILSALKILFFVVLPLLIIAAIIEGSLIIFMK
jgi:stage II sporulation protein M